MAVWKGIYDLWPFWINQREFEKDFDMFGTVATVFVLEPTWYELWVFGYVCFGTCLNEGWDYLDHFQAFYQ